jgi:hypothetical protein
MLRTGDLGATIGTEIIADSATGGVPQAAADAGFYSRSR